ncbi:MAG: gliding motility protein GldM [Bacteroidota bacterium]|nr:gliding motility protein GldM [Bacteroidota bacterium]
MAAYKETPRQKMIGMMYLVLTALLALNVSVEILNAFIVVNESMETTNVKMEEKIGGTYSKFEQQYEINKNKVGEYWAKAQQARTEAKEFRDYITKMKYEIISLCENKPIAEIKNVPLGEIKGRDKYDQTTNYFVPNTENLKKGKANELKKKFLQYRENMLSLVDPEVRDNFKIGPDFDGPFYTADGEKEPWEMHNFFHVVLAADVTILNELIMEVNNAEFDIVNFLYSSVSEEDFKFNKIAAKIVPKSSYIMLGEQYEASVFVAAYDTTQNPEVFIQQGVDTITDINNATKIEGLGAGFVNLNFPTTATGTKKYAGVIRVKDPMGISRSYHFHNEYSVARKSMTVSATKMNVFYIGVDNPVSISVPGIADYLLRPKINVGVLKKDPETNNWIVNVSGKSKATKATIDVFADVDGKIRGMGHQKFRLKRIPDPIPSIGKYTKGKVKSNVLIGMGGVYATMPEYFDFDYNFRVKEFDMVYVGAGQTSKRFTARNHKFTSEMVDVMKTARKGTRVWFENIIVEAPEGRRELNSITIIID